MIVLLAALFASLSADASASLFVRSFPVDYVVVGEPFQNLTIPAGSTVVECITHLWRQFNEIPLVVSHGGSKCVGFKKVYGMEKSKDPEIKSYLLTTAAKDAEKCFSNLTKELESIFKCEPNWIRLELSELVACYRAIPNSEYKGYIKRANSDLLAACKAIYPYSNAASIHSRQEELLIAKRFKDINTDEQKDWAGYKIGFRLDDPKDSADASKWYWTDGSSRSYEMTLDQKEFFAYCKKKKCSHAALYWKPQLADDNVLIGGADENTRELLCKYTLIKYA